MRPKSTSPEMVTAVIIQKSSNRNDSKKKRIYGFNVDSKKSTIEQKMVIDKGNPEPHAIKTKAKAYITS